LRKHNSFVDLCKKPKLAAEVALGPIQDFDFDVAILFSDLLFPLEALGLGLSYDKGGPELSLSLEQKHFSNFRSFDSAMDMMMFQKEAMQETRKILPANKSLIGFVGGPWTLFVYAVEGSHKGSLIEAKKRAPSLFPAFCEFILPLLKRNIEIQFEGGAEAVMILDTAAGELSPQQAQDWIVNPLRALMPIDKKSNIGYYAKHSSLKLFELMNQDRGPDTKLGIGVDHRFELAPILKSQRYSFVQGNFDQILLHQASNDFEKALRQYLAPLSELSLEERRGWICGVGHGLVPHTPEAHVRSFVKIVREVFA
jgi:uroporphyrinogen decarboxylase